MRYNRLVENMFPIWSDPTFILFLLFVVLVFVAVQLSLYRRHKKELAIEHQKVISLERRLIEVSVDNRNYSAVDSRNTVQGDENNLSDNSINMGESFSQRQERLAALDDLIGKLKAFEFRTEAIEKAEKSLTKVRDELTEEANPHAGTIKRWLNTAKNSLGTAALSYEVIEVGKKVWEMFGI
jgi:hypothetical protein